jgi:hypothetical protein
MVEAPGKFLVHKKCCKNNQFECFLFAKFLSGLRVKIELTIRIKFDRKSKTE